MQLRMLLTNGLQFLKTNSPEILTALGTSGVLTTAYLSAQAGKRHAAKMGEQSPYLSTKEEAQLVWKFYIPAGISGALTVGCIIAASKGNHRRTAAAVTAYSLSERAFTEYREKVVEQIGKGKEQKIRDEIVQDKVSRTHPNSREVIVVGGGNVLCCELYTNRYFRSDMETLRRAQNDLNAKIINQLYVPLDEFYDLIGLSYTSNSGTVGWDSDKLMELRFSAVVSSDGEPCLAFDYSYLKPLK